MPVTLKSALPMMLESLTLISLKVDSATKFPIPFLQFLTTMLPRVCKVDVPVILLSVISISPNTSLLPLNKFHKSSQLLGTSYLPLISKLPLISEFAIFTLLLADTIETLPFFVLNEYDELGVFTEAIEMLPASFVTN